jgi:hypothetical protein
MKVGYISLNFVRKNSFKKDRKMNKSHQVCESKPGTKHLNQWLQTGFLLIKYGPQISGCVLYFGFGFLNVSKK